MNTPERSRIAFDVSPQVNELLDHISLVTGVPKSGMALAALLDNIPELLARADAIKKRSQELGQSKNKR